MREILTVQQVSKATPEQALRGLSFSVPEQAVFGLVGPCNAGKTLLLRLLLGQVGADSGEITVAGEPVRCGNSPTNRFIGYLPSRPSFYPDMKPLEYLSLCGTISGLSPAQCRERSLWLLGQLGLTQAHLRCRIAQFSYGMRMSLNIAQALLHQPKLLVCDDPFADADDRMRQYQLEKLLAVRGKASVLLATRSFADAQRVCDSVAVLDDGAIVLAGTVRQLLEACPCRRLSLRFSTRDEAEQFCQAPRMARYAAQLTTEADGTLVLRTPQLREAEAAVLATLDTLGLFPAVLQREEPSLAQLFHETMQ